MAKSPTMPPTVAPIIVPVGAEELLAACCWTFGLLVCVDEDGLEGNVAGELVVVVVVLVVVELEVVVVDCDGTTTPKVGDGVKTK
jgi:hypothetical protein